MKFLVFGDVVGKGGRDAISKALPDLKREFEPDSVIINIENIAHGKGVSPDTYNEAKAWKADVFTTGDHAWDKPVIFPILNNKKEPIVRPANYPTGIAGRGYHIYSMGAYRVAVINLQGQVFFRNHPANPFHALDEILKISEVAEANITLLDFHAEATSEKKGLGWHADGRISAMWGTHTHVPTNDAQILPKGTGYLSDVGMNGAYHSIIGVDVKSPLKTFLTQLSSKMEPNEDPPFEVNAVYMDIDPVSGKTIEISSVRRILS